MDEASNSERKRSLQFIIYYSYHIIWKGGESHYFQLEASLPYDYPYHQLEQGDLLVQSYDIKQGLRPGITKYWICSDPFFFEQLKFETKLRQPNQSRRGLNLKTTSMEDDLHGR